MMPVSGQGRVSADELMNRYMAANGLAGGGMGAGGPGFAGGGMGGMGGGGNSMAAENQQDRKQAFLANTPKPRCIWHVSARRRSRLRRKSKPVGSSPA